MNNTAKTDGRFEKRPSVIIQIVFGLFTLLLYVFIAHCVH